MRECIASGGLFMDRRQAMKSAAIAALFGFQVSADAADSPALPDPALRQRDPEAYWLRIRNEQFFLPDWRAFLNNGSLGVAPKPVVQAVLDYLERSAALQVEGYPRWGYETLDEHRTEMAEFLGCQKDELAFTHCATDSINIIVNGLDLKAGDEVVITDREHPSGWGPWRQKAARYGIQVKEVPIPIPPRDPGQLADLLISAIGPRTRVLFFSGIISATGYVLPVRQICDAARAKGVLTVVDGAHMNGQIPVRLSDLHCDFYAGSPHKWMFTPAGCGILYAGEEAQDRLWVNVTVGDNWANKKMKAARFMMVGTNNRAIFEGMMAGLRFLKQIGPEHIYARIHQMAQRAAERVRNCPYTELLTPADDRMFGGLLYVGFKKGLDLAPLWQECNRKKIWVSQGERFRLSTHIHTRPQDLAAFFDVVEQTLHS